MENKLSKEWVDRIFFRLHEIFGTSWAIMMDPSRTGIYRDTWRTALKGLTADEIREALAFYKGSNKTLPPTSIEFYLKAKKKEEGFANFAKQCERTPEVMQKAKDALADAKRALGIPL